VLPVSVAENVGVTPGTAALLLSLIVIVIVEAEEPSAITGLVPVIEEFGALKAVTVTVVVTAPLFGVPVPVAEHVLLPLLYGSSFTVQVPVVYGDESMRESVLELTLVKQLWNTVLPKGG